MRERELGIVIRISVQIPTEDAVMAAYFPKCIVLEVTETFVSTTCGLPLTKHSPGARLTSWHTVPGPSVGDAVLEAGVVVVLTAGGSMGVRHDWVVNGVGLCQGLEHHIVWTGAVLVGGALREE